LLFFVFIVTLPDISCLVNEMWDQPKSLLTFWGSCFPSSVEQTGSGYNTIFFRNTAITHPHCSLVVASLLLTDASISLAHAVLVHFSAVSS